MSRHTTFSFTLLPSREQEQALRRHVGAARFAFNQCLRLVVNALEAKRQVGKSAEPAKVPWSGFDLINAFNAWKRSEDSAAILSASEQGLGNRSGDPHWRARAGASGAFAKTRQCARARKQASTAADAAERSSEDLVRDGEYARGGTLAGESACRSLAAAFRAPASPGGGKSGGHRSRTEYLCGRGRRRRTRARAHRQPSSAPEDAAGASPEESCAQSEADRFTEPLPCTAAAVARAWAARSG